jgi:predicted TIM-barrel fold metal-dependent hydrolase
LRIVDETPLSPAERRAILGETAARLFHVSCDCAG